MPQPQQEKVDYRLYLGMLFFRWQIIALCFLYCLLGGVLYIHLTPKEYQTQCSIIAYRDPNTIVGRGNPYSSYGTYSLLLSSPKLRARAVDRLEEKWGKVMGGPARMGLGVSSYQSRGGMDGPTLVAVVRSVNPRYAEAFLSSVVGELQSEWQSMQMAGSAAATVVLEKELAKLDEKVRAAEDDVIEYQRLHDLQRTALKSSDEAGWLATLFGRRRALLTELMMLERMYPMLKNSDDGVIRNAMELTRETATLVPEETPDDAEQGAPPPPAGGKGKGEDPARFLNESSMKSALDDGWHEQRLKMARLKLREKELLSNLTEEHPQVKEVRKEIAGMKNELDVAAQLELARMQDRHTALTFQLQGIEDAEYKWQAKYFFANQRMGELGRLRSIVGRLEANYRALFDRLQAMKVDDEIKVEHFNVVAQPSSSSKPVWPDPMKVLFVVVIAGLGSGLGLALAAHVFDNKIQSIRDVEKELGISFLGGVPYWIHSGLESSIRPIVTEEHSTGAVEAYRALRTTLINSLNKINERIVFFTSADSKEGKTLTSLNISIMIAQMGKKVLLIDMDLRRGRLHRSLGIEKEPGMTDVLKESIPLRDVIQKTKVENLYLAPAGSSIEDAAELLQSSDLMNMLVDLQNDYDYICVDTSPVLRVTDSVILCTQGVGVVVYVARVNHTPKPLIRYSLEMLKDAKVLGLIMNSIEMHKVSSLYYTYQYPNYAYYSNAYAYGYNYYYEEENGAKGVAPRRRAAHHRNRSPRFQWLRDKLLPRA